MGRRGRPGGREAAAATVRGVAHQTPANLQTTRSVSLLCLPVFLILLLFRFDPASWCVAVRPSWLRQDHAGAGHGVVSARRLPASRRRGGLLRLPGVCCVCVSRACLVSFCVDVQRGGAHRPRHVHSRALLIAVHCVLRRDRLHRRQTIL